LRVSCATKQCKDSHRVWLLSFIVFFFNDTATTEIYTLSLHDALPISERLSGTLAGEAPLGLEINEILTELFGADQVGRPLKVFGQVAHTGPVTLLAAGLERQQGQIFGKAVQDCVRGTFFICIDLQVMVDGLPCVVHGEPSAACGSRGPRP